MALTVTRQGSSSSTTSSTTLTATGFVVAKFARIIVVVAADNAGTSGASSVTGISDTAGNVWNELTSAATLRNPSSTANTGVSLRWFETFTSKIFGSTDVITVSFSPSTTSKTMIVWSIVSSTPNNTWAVTDIVGPGGSGNATGITAGTGNVVSGDVLIGAIGVETNATAPGDTDVTAGSWSTLTQVTANTGTVGTSIILASQVKTTTAAGNQTYNMTMAAAANYAGRHVAYAEFGWNNATGAPTISRTKSAGVGYQPGTSTTTNVNDTVSAIGTVSASGITGTLAYTNANDTSAATGTVVWPTITGSSSTTNANDTSTATGTVTIVGNSATTNVNDTSTAAGTVTTTGSSTTSNNNDTSTASGAVSSPTTGTSTTTNANDSAFGLGAVIDPNQGGSTAEVGFVNPLPPHPRISGFVATRNQTDAAISVGVVHDLIAATGVITHRSDRALFDLIVAGWEHAERDDEDLLLLI